MLPTTNRSLSLQNNVSQGVILAELDKLKSSIDEAFRASLHSTPGFGHRLNSHTRVSRNLRNLAEAARQFHSAASSSASTVRDGSIAPWGSHSNRPMSLLGDFPAYRRERVEMFLQDAVTRQSLGAETPARVASPLTDLATNPRVSAMATLPPITIPVQQEFIAEEDDDDAEFERLFLDGLEDLAKESIKNRDFDKAIELLQQAMAREQGLSSDHQHLCRLQTQLALCYLFQGNWRAAEPIVSSLAKSKGTWDLIVCNMLHAIALAYLNTYCFDNAMKICKQALQCKKGWFKSKGLTWQDTPEYGETLGLLATISEMTGDYIGAEIYRRQLPPGFVYQHPANRTEFIAKHTVLLGEVLGDDLPDFAESPILDIPLEFHELDAGVSPIQHSAAGVQRKQTMRRSKTLNDGNISPLRARRCQWERTENDTLKEVCFSTPDLTTDMDADDEASTSSASPILVSESPLRRRITRIFTTKSLRSTPDEPVEAVLEKTDPVIRKAPTAPIAGLLRAANVFTAKKSKTLLRKPTKRHSSIPLGTFRLLRMKRITLRGSENDGDVLYPPKEHSAVPELESDSATSAAVLSDSPSISILNKQGYGNESLSAPEITEGLESHAVELPTTSEPGASSVSPKRDNDTSAYLREYSLLSSMVDKTTANGRLSHLALPERSVQDPAVEEVRAVWATRSGLQKSLPLPATEERLSPTIMIPHQLKASDHTIAHKPQDSASPGFEAYSAKAATKVPVQGINATLAQLADVIVSLPQTRDAEKLHAAKLDLEIIALHLRPLSTDTVLLFDIERIIRSLGNDKAVGADQDNASDSGYETMSPDSLSSKSGPTESPSDAQDVSVAASTAAKAQVGKDVIEKRRKKPALKPHSPARVNPGKPQMTCSPVSKPKQLDRNKEKGDFIASPRKQVSWATDASTVSLAPLKSRKPAIKTKDSIESTSSREGIGEQSISTRAIDGERVQSCRKWDR